MHFGIISLLTNYKWQLIDRQADNILINLASDEYFKALKIDQLQAKVIKPIFLDEKNGQFKQISFYAKKARGMMARFILVTKPTTIEQLKTFDYGGYWFDENDSTSTELIFKREAR